MTDAASVLWAVLDDGDDLDAEVLRAANAALDALDAGDDAALVAACGAVIEGLRAAGRRDLAAALRSAVAATGRWRAGRR